MTWVDAVIIVVALLAAFSGFRQGLVRTIFSFLGLVVGVVVAGWTADPLAEKISPDATWAYVLAFIIIMIVVLFIFNLIGSIVKQFIKVIMLGWVDSLGGALLGLFVGSLLAAAALIAVGKWASMVGDTGIEEAIGASPLAKLLIDNFRLLLSLLPERFDVVRDFFT